MENLNTVRVKKVYKILNSCRFRLFMRVSFFIGFSICKSHSAY